MRWETKLSGLMVVSCLLIKSTTVNTQPRNGETHKSNLICQERHYASVGEDVTLDCHFKPQRDVTKDSVAWRFGSDTVLLYRSMKFSLDAQAERFRDTAEKDSTWDPAKGKLAVKIKSFRKTDAGKYNCSVGKDKDKVSCHTEVILKQPGDPGDPRVNKRKEPPTTPSQSPKNIGDPVVTLVLATFALLYSLCH